MERNREGRRASIVGSNGFNRRRHRTTNSLRDSPDEDGGVELQESLRLRDRVKKDRDRERERERERERDLRDKSRSKRTRGERLVSNRDDLGEDETSEESVNYDDEDEDEENAAASGGRLLPPAVGSISNHHHHGHVSNHHHSSPSQQHNSSSTNHNLQHRKSFPPGSSSTSSSSKSFRAAPVWKPGDEIISVPVPRKARSASTKRLHDWISSSSNNNGVGGDQIIRQASNSPVRQGLVSTPALPPAGAPTSPSSNPPIRKKLKSSANNGGPKLKPPKSSLKQTSSNPEELEIEIAEVLFGLSHQTQRPSSKKDDSKPIPTSANNQILGSNSSSLQAVAPKRKRPRQVPESSNRSSPKVEMDQTPKSEISSPSSEKIGSEMVSNRVDSVQPAQPEPVSQESTPMTKDLRETQDLVAKEDKEKESPAVRINDSSMLTATAAVTATIIKANSEVETQTEQKFEIDLMAPPQQVRSSPERETKNHSAVDQKLVLSESKHKEDSSRKDKDDKKEKIEKEQLAKVEEEEKKVEEDKEPEKKIDLQFGLGKPEINGNSENKLPVKENKEEPVNDKSGQLKSSLPLPVPVPMATWPGGLSPMGYMAPLQGVVSMDGSTVAPAPVQQPLFSQPRQKRCATHCYIARNIHYLQQMMKVNPFWQAASTSASFYGSKSSNLIMPADAAARGLNSAALDKSQSISSSSSPNHGGKDKGSQPAGTPDLAHRKQQQLVIQQASPPVASNNLLGPAFIFSMNQQQAAAAAASASAARPSSVKSPPPTTGGSGTASSNLSGSADTSASAAATVSFNYPNMAANETQYLAILQNNGYPFPIPTVGPPPNYRGTPPRGMPLFNGSFYPSQMIHPSQLQHQHQQTQSTQSHQLQQAHQNGNALSGSSSQKQRPHSSSGGTGNANSPPNFPSQKSQPPQQSQQSHNQHMHPLGSEDSSAMSDSRGSRAAAMNIYGQNFTMPIHPQNFALMTQSAALAAVNGSSNQSEKKSQQPPNSFAMSFGQINGSNASLGFDLTSMAHNHAILQNFPEATRQNFQMMAAAAQATQKKNFRASEEDNKSGGGDSSAISDERKSSVTKAQSIAFTRADSSASGPSIQANSVIESSSRSQSQPVTTTTSGANSVNMHGVFQQQQILQLKQKHQQQMAANRNKALTTSNGNMFSENMNSAVKFPNALSGFPQNLIQSNNSSPSQSPQWKSSTRAPTSQGQAPSSTTATLKNLPQHHSRAPTKMQTQISFGGNQKPLTTSQGSIQAQAQSTPVMVGSPTTGAGESPRTASSQTQSLSNQQPKNSPTIPSQKSPSVLGNPHGISVSSSNGAKPSMQQQQSQPQHQPKNIHQAQFFFSSNPYAQAQPPHSMTANSNPSGPGGFYMQQQQRRRPDQQQQPPQHRSASSTSTNDPAKAIAAATTKGGGIPSMSAAQSGGTLLPAGFSYVHPVPSTPAVKPAEAKQPAGNDNLHTWQPDKK